MNSIRLSMQGGRSGPTLFVRDSRARIKFWDLDKGAVVFGSIGVAPRHALASSTAEPKVTSSMPLDIHPSSEEA
jgi:hypothetical protein